MSYAICRMEKMKSYDLKGMQFHNQRERESKTNTDIDYSKSHLNVDLVNEQNIDYNERVREIIESQKTSTRKTRKDAVLVNELLVTSDKKFFDGLMGVEQKRFFEESVALFSDRYGEQNIAYAMVHYDEKTPHLHLGVVPMRDGKLQGKNVFDRKELLWIQNEFPKHMQEKGFDLKRGERGSTREHVETQKFKQQTLEEKTEKLQQELDKLGNDIAIRKNEIAKLHEEIADEVKIKATKQMRNVEVPTGQKNIFGIEKTETKKEFTGFYTVSAEQMKILARAARQNKMLKEELKNYHDTDIFKTYQRTETENVEVKQSNMSLRERNLNLQKQNEKLEQRNNDLKARVSFLEHEMTKLYETIKEFLGDAVEDVRASLRTIIDRLRAKVGGSEFENVHERSVHSERQERLKREQEAKEQRQKENSADLFSIGGVRNLNREIQQETRKTRSRSYDIEL